MQTGMSMGMRMGWGPEWGRTWDGFSVQVLLLLLLFVIVIAPDIVLVRMTSTSCRSCKDAGEKDEDGGEDAAAKKN